MPGLVLEGGSFRTAFTLGVLDVLIKNEIYFPYIIGVSAGACAASSYMSGQYYRGIDIFLKYRNSKEYQSIYNLVKDKSLFGIKYIYEDIPNEICPFDYDAYKHYPGDLEVVVTDAFSGEAAYLNGKAYDYHNEQFIATCSLPGIFPGVRLNGSLYFDGGVADSIPLERSVFKGNRKNLVVSTRTEDYVKTLDAKTKIMARTLSHKYPKLAEAMNNRYIMYNRQRDLLKKETAAGRALAIYPSLPYNDIEPDDDRLLRAYHDGVEQAVSKIAAIRQLFDD